MDSPSGALDGKRSDLLTKLFEVIKDDVTARMNPDDIIQRGWKFLNEDDVNAIKSKEKNEGGHMILLRARERKAWSELADALDSQPACLHVADFIRNTDILDFYFGKSSTDLASQNLISLLSSAVFNRGQFVRAIEELRKGKFISGEIADDIKKLGDFDGRLKLLSVVAQTKNQEALIRLQRFVAFYATKSSGVNMVAYRDDYVKASANTDKLERALQDFDIQDDSGFYSPMTSFLPTSGNLTASSPSFEFLESHASFLPDPPISRQRKPFEMSCRGCGSHVTASKDLRILVLRSPDQREPSLHRAVIDRSFINRIRVHAHWEPRRIGKTKDLGRDVFKEKKISCKECGNDWGVCVRIQEKYFFFIKIDTLTVVAEGRAMYLSKWKKLCYVLRFITDRELMTYGFDEIPPDCPVPAKWHDLTLSSSTDDDRERSRCTSLQSGTRHS